MILLGVQFLMNFMSLLVWKNDEEEDISYTEEKKLGGSLSKDEIYRLRKKHVANACILFYDPNPLQIVRAKGQYMYDEEDNEYLDCINNVCHVGHCHPEVVTAACKQMGILNTNSRYLSHLNSTYSQQLTSLFPAPLDTVFFVNSGSEATELSLELCRVWNDATDFICVDSGYHGHTRSAITISNYKFGHPRGIGQPDFVQMMDLPDTYRGQHRDVHTAGEKYGAQAELLVQNINNRGAKVAGFIGESAISCGGQIMLPPNYLKTVYKAVHKAGGLCIADEVQVGFGRCGTGMWVFEKQGVVPDIVTIGKPMGNGHPIAGVVTTREIAERYRQNRPEYFNTYGGNPVSMAVGLAVLDVIKKEGLVKHAKVTGDLFLLELERLKERHSCIGDVRGIGLFLGIEFVKCRESREPDENTAVFVKKEMYRNRIIVSTEGRHNNIVKIKPPMSFDQNNVAHFINHFDRAISQVKVQ
ncbi:alanine--glyoxylate aminotransferase 2-like isoform X2 [Bolinopsis microptera]|uniref:alanine--glyoxylate aminotransferase 2-like isoform X2 n=1 Tax=Bolinopsis microptera TaxID=2820187 RepID=UPI00307AC6A3